MITSLEKKFMESVINLCRRFHNDGPDWEQRRYEIAKDILSAQHGNYPLTVEEGIDFAVEVADTLIAKLKEQSK